MILFEKIRWKNFLSTGNQFIEIDLTRTDTTLIVGTNGAGKSTVLDALTFSLFNKPFRKISKGQLVNTVNEKDCKVEVEFSTGSTEWKVIRGIKPNSFEIHRNGTVLDQFSAANDQQKWLEQNVLKMNYKSFTQIVILGSSTFVTFMQLSASNRREVIEDLLDIKIFSSMNSLIKDKIRLLREEIRTLNLKKESLTDKVRMQEDFINEIESRGKESMGEKTDKIKVLEVEVATHMEMNTIKECDISDLIKKQQVVTGATEKLRKLGDLRGKISNKVSTVTKEHKFFKQNTICPTCTQDIAEELDRLKVHILSMQNLLSSSGVVGKKLDFLSQELNREVNTICSKSQFSELTNVGIEMKTLVDQFREQVQNVE